MGLLDKAMTAAAGGSRRGAGRDGKALLAEWQRDRSVQIAAPEPEDLAQLRTAVDVGDPGSVAAHWVYSVLCLTADRDVGMSMMKYLFADIEPFGRGFTEGGAAGRAGWDPYFDERLRDDEYRWLPRAYFVGATVENGFHPARPLAVELRFNEPNTRALNAQGQDALGRLSIVYTARSNAAGNKVNIELARFDGSNRFYVTNAAASAGLFFDQRSALTAQARVKLWA